MLDKIKGIEERFADLEKKLQDAATIANNREFARLARERAQLVEVTNCAREYRKLLDEVAEHKSILDGDDAELRELAKAHAFAENHTGTGQVVVEIK